MPVDAELARALSLLQSCELVAIEESLQIYNALLHSSLDRPEDDRPFMDSNQTCELYFNRTLALDAMGQRVQAIASARRGVDAVSPLAPQLPELKQLLQDLNHESAGVEEVEAEEVEGYVQAAAPQPVEQLTSGGSCDDSSSSRAHVSSSSGDNTKSCRGGIPTSDNSSVYLELQLLLELQYKHVEQGKHTQPAAVQVVQLLLRMAGTQQTTWSGGASLVRCTEMTIEALEGTDGMAALLAALLRALDGTDGNLRRCAVDVFAALPTRTLQSAAAQLVDRLVHHSAPVRWAAITVVRKVANQQSVAVFRGQKMLALEAVFRDRVMQIVKSFQENLQHKAWYVRGAATRALGALPCDVVVQHLPTLSSVGGEQKWWVRCALLQVYILCAQHLLKVSE